MESSRWVDVEAKPVAGLGLPLLALCLAGLVLAGGAAAEAPAEAPAEAASTGPPDVLLITVDTLRPDALGWVAGRNATPVIDGLAASGYRFPSAVSPLPLTQPAHASLFTGLRPRRHGVRSNGRVLNQGIPVLSEALGRAGYRTAAFVSGYPLAKEGGLDRGFAHYDDRFTEGASGRQGGQGVERSAADTVQAASAWLARGSGPWFVWLHFYDPHDPYQPPQAHAGGSGPRAAYDGEVRAVDAAIGQFLATADDPRRQRLTIFTADHGESLGDHGETTHGFFIYESTMAIPLIVHWPQRVRPGQSGEAVRLLDVSPTILDLLGLPAFEAIDGTSLRPLMEGKAWLTPDAYMESQRPWLSYGWAPLRALRRGPWKLIAAPRSELYHLGEDPGETTNLLSRERRLAGDLATTLEAIEARPAASGGVLDDPQTLARLRSLGYTGGAVDEDAAPADAVDPKLRLEQWHLLGEAQQLLDDGRLTEALERFDRVLAEDADNPFALGRSGAALAEAGQMQAAIPRLQRVVELRPDDHEARSALARALTRGRQLDAAIGHWMELTRRQPRRLDGWTNLASTLGMSGAPEKAVEAFEHALSLDPERPDTLIKLAFAHHGAKQPGRAIDRLLAATRLMGAQNFPHSGALGILLLRAGRGGEAAPWLARSRPQEGDFAEARYQLARWLATQGDRERAEKALAEALERQPDWRARAAEDDVLKALLP